MTTTNDTAIRKIIALRDRALHAGANSHEADTALAMARKLCDKHGVDVSILDKQPETVAVRKVVNGYAQPARRYSCRYGCGMFVQHTIDELNACAEKARNASATGSAYDAPKTDPYADFWKNFDAPRDEPKPQSKPRTNSSHRYCDHEATKAARAKCRKARGY